MEGWATFAESYILAVAHGPAVERAFWAAQRNDYERLGFEGRVSILGDQNNEGVAYNKGAWVFRMLRDALGEAAFARGLRAYMATPPGQAAGLEEFAAALSRAAGRDVGPLLRPWLEEAVTPDVTARVVADARGRRVVLTQAGPVFELPALEIALVTAAGDTARQQVRLITRETVLDVSDVGALTDVLVDPDHRLLLRRHRGEVARFEWHAPGAARVALAGDFAAAPAPAARDQEGIWRVEVPLTEGQYAWHWLVDGRRPLAAPSAVPPSGVRIVRPLRDLPRPDDRTPPPSRQNARHRGPL
jgi:hypothetical protein